ncbi:hypothetical protein KKA15_01260 [Patescibacteria group bacterium]|nr:hypothetical protein [Patescibacteria group bacterium]
MSILKRKKIDSRALANYGILAGLAQFCYILGVVFIMNNIGRFFQTQDSDFTILMPVLFLLIFIFSATVSALMVLGGPAYLWHEKKYKEAMQVLGISLSTLFFAAVLVFLVIINF